MSDWNFLKDAFATISDRQDEIDEKIQRLKQAKTAIETEQDAALKEIKRIYQPSLNRMWEGTDGEDYDSARQDAYESMQRYIRQYDFHLMEIDRKIRQLELQRGALDVTSSIARSAQYFLEQGEEMANVASTQINKLKGRLFG
ncbi:DNA repair exonuclease SbcCD ATPase subunit [Gracilibacillus halotolerans]|uniref:DNA repair exonuclease SbcCD ATPase subunit n=1 Tax=Gracilibacillus halotolerans TaxID=74386 RepID=A0A841RHT6_9BACI|nr:DUF5082 family protein [Gracilibacillus halotolerans]MBB6512049.1 DNA repair exonuclease SbcCD ATPase subunit [Gracilibacillus halotolerans]